jgi:hypothetical protein
MSCDVDEGHDAKVLFSQELGTKEVLHVVGCARNSLVARHPSNPGRVLQIKVGPEIERWRNKLPFYGLRKKKREHDKINNKFFFKNLNK